MKNPTLHEIKPYVLAIEQLETFLFHDLMLTKGQCLYDRLHIGTKMSAHLPAHEAQEIISSLQEAVRLEIVKIIKKLETEYGIKECDPLCKRCGSKLNEEKQCENEECPNRFQTRSES